ncbi:hypothetical protein [Kaarinaea lacus]
MIRPQLVSETLPATGIQSTILNVREFGRYAVLADSNQGAALQVIDRMAGPGEVVGKAGEQNGRLDQFFDRGDYKIITHAHESGTGEVNLSVHTFTELHGTNIPQLIKLKDISLSLNDFQQRSFWLHIEKRETIAIEAAGRNLADLRLWKDGNWLMDLEPVAKQIFPHPEKPLQAMQLNVPLEPGLYLLTAYGGPPQSWTEQSDEHPLYIRYGIPRLDETGQRRYAVSVFGTDRYLVPGNSNYFNLSVPEATAISMTADSFRENAAFSSLGRTVRISKKSIPPVTELETRIQKENRLLTVTGTAGQSYILQHFEKRWRYSFSHSGPYWLSSIHSGAAADSVDATSILIRLPRFQREQFLDARAIKLDRTMKYERQFNLLDNVTLYLEIADGGSYIVKGQGEGVAAKYRIEPFLTSRPRDYQAPPFEDSGYKWELDPGFYVLTVRPELKGILTLTVEKEGYLQFRDSSVPTVSGATRYGIVHLDSDSHYTMYINQQPGVSAGVVLRRAPVDLSTELPVMQRGNETVSIPVKLPEAGTVRAVSTTGAALELSLRKHSWEKQLTLAAGEYEITIRNPSNETVNYSIEFAAERLNESTPLPGLPSQVLHSIPNFPSLMAGQPIYLDLDRDQPAMYLLKVDKPALYRLETSGLLDTEGNLRTRTNPSLIRQQTNGVGRNFLIQQYLRAGDYQLTVKPRYQSRGHLGLHLEHAAIVDGGRLTTDVAVRAALHAGKGLLYRFNIQQKGKYRVRAIGSGRTYVMRLEDADGWPIESPNIAADIIREFDVGEYRMIIRPEAVDARVVTTLDAISEPTHFQGHGPHTISIGQTVQHQWQEPEKGQPRDPDTWVFEVPASADISITLNNDMLGELVSAQSNGQQVLASITPLGPWQGRLAAGQYQLAVKNLRKNNHVSYQLTISSRQLMIGQHRQSGVPATIPVAVGEQGFIELWSYGQNDVRARLVDSSGNVIAQGDDRSNDWNFLITQKLPAGEYQLGVEAVGNDTQPTMVFMRAPSTHLAKAQSLPMVTTISDNDAHVYPLNLPQQKSLLVVQAKSEDVIGLSVETQDRRAGDSAHWRELGSATGQSPNILLPYSNNTSQTYRLRVWSVDRRGGHISLLAQAIEPAHYSERQLTQTGIKLDPISNLEGGTLPIAVSIVDLTHPGMFIIDSTKNVLWSSNFDQLLSETDTGLIGASDTRLWIARRLENNQSVAKLSGLRMALDERNTNGLQIAVPPHQISHLDVQAHAKPLMVIAESRVGLAGLQFINNQAAAQPLTAQQFAIAQHTAVAVGVNTTNPVVKVWNAGDPSELLEVNLKRVPLSLMDTQVIGEGYWQNVLPAASALPFALPPGLKRITLTYPPHTAALLRRQDKIMSTHWSGSTSLNEVTYSLADKILILNAGAETHHIALTIDSLASLSGSVYVPPVLTENQMFQRRMVNIGQLRIPVELSEVNKRRVIRVRGTYQQGALQQGTAQQDSSQKVASPKATYIQHDGRVLRGTDLEIAEPGELIIEHGSGVVLVWLDVESNSDSTSPIPVLDVTANHRVSLHGERHAFQVSLQQSSQLLVRSDTALISRITYASGKEVVEAHPQGMNYSVYLPAGYNKVSFYPLGASTMGGMMFLSSVPIVPIQEGFGPEVLLSGGSTQMFQFDVHESGYIGLGINASSDVVSGKLMDIAGNIVSEGVVHMPLLQPGRYIFAVSVPQDSHPVRVRTALVGLERPPAGPPWEVIKEYLQRAGRKLDVPASQP